MHLGNKIQLFLLHFSGGNIYSFQFLKPHLPPNFEFLPIELPGRGKRMNEKFVTTETEAVMDLVNQITLLRNTGPYLVFGHSMGASLGLRVTKKLEELGDPPQKLIVAGNAGPGTGEGKLRSSMTDEELKNELRILGGVPEEVLNNDDLFNFFAPILRSDFKVLEEAVEITNDFKLNFPINAIMGDQEETSEQIENWKNFTSKEFKSFHLPGNHFFIFDSPKELIEIIKN